MNGTNKTCRACLLFHHSFLSFYVSKRPLPDLHFHLSNTASYQTKDLSTKTAVMKFTGELEP